MSTGKRGGRSAKRTTSNGRKIKRGYRQPLSEPKWLRTLRRASTDQGDT